MMYSQQRMMASPVGAIEQADKTFSLEFVLLSVFIDKCMCI